MKRKSIYSISLFLLTLTACTKKYEKINTNANAIVNPGAGELPFLFTRAEDQAMFSTSYQVAQNLNADQYAQYFACESTSFPSDRYVMRSDWFNSAWLRLYTGVVPQLQTIFAQTDPNSSQYALANIVWVLAFHRITDYWGPIPYFKVGQPGTSVPYDGQDKIYDDFFKRLTTAVNVLKTKTGETPFSSYDIIFGGKVDKWIKFANTLRLRLALRISKADPVRAKTEAEAAYAAGVMTASPDDDALLQKSLNGGDINGLAQMSDWNEFRMSAAMESVLKGYNDPRMPIYFLPAVNTGTYEGLRNGLTATQLTLPANSVKANSHVGARWSSPAAGGITDFQITPQNVMCSAEAWFLRAEGALLGWNMGGTPKSLYESGITQSLKQWGITDNTTITAYINGITPAIAPGDYLNSPALVSFPVLFDPVNPAVQQAQISMQKWLALFPDGCEAWADYRRSKSFSLYPIANSDNPDVTDPSKQWIRRLSFLQQEFDNNSAAMGPAVDLLKGPDKITTPLWWDKN